MDQSNLRSSLSTFLKNNANWLYKAAPVTLAVALASVALIPGIKEGSPDLVLGASVLSGVGVEFLKDIGKKAIGGVGKKKGEEARKELEKGLLKMWNTPGEKGAAFRRDLSQFLRQNGILQIALDEAPDEIRGSMAHSLASLADQFGEFKWMLGEIRDILEVVQERQVEQLATQREQLELQREQLAKTNMLLKSRRKHPKGTPLLEDQEELPPADLNCPYKGLAAFQPEDADFFFGREALTAHLLARLAGASFLAVIGPSGSGKSSLVRAGLVPALWNGEIPGSADWKVLILRPGSKPLEELAVRVALQSGISAVSLLEDLRKDPHALNLSIKQFLVGHPDGKKFVLVVDQFEELFAQCEIEAERKQFIDALVDAASSGSGHTIVILSLRADFYGRCAAYPELADLLSANQVLVGAMSDEELRQAITKPAKQTGLVLEPGLVEMVVQEAHGEAGALPMVSHALMETWKRRNGNILKVAAYQAFGGLRQAISTTAEQVYNSSPETDQDQLRELFLRLTQLGDDSLQGGYRDIRRRVAVHDLVPAGGSPEKIELLLNKLADARLIVKDVGNAQEPEVEVAHEALIQNWDRLHAWLNSDRDVLRLRQGVTEAAHEWEAGNKDTNLLIHRGGRLDDAFKLREKMTAQEQGYLRACKKEVQRRRRRVIGGIAFATTAIVCVLLGWSLTSTRNARELSYQAATANVAVETAQAASTYAIAQRGTAEAERYRAEEQVRLTLARQLAAQAQFLSTTRSSKANIAVLLAIESMKLSPSVESAQVLQNNTLFLPVSCMVHERAVDDVAFSPDGKYAISGGWDGIARVWDVQTGQEIASMTHGGRVTAVAFSPDGKYVVSGSLDGTARVWEAKTGQEIVRVRQNIDIWTIAYSPDGRYFVAGSWGDDTVRVWDAQTGQEISRMTHDGNVYTVAFSPDGKYIVSGSDDYTARIWDAQTGQEITRVTHRGTVNSATFSPDGNYVVTGSDDGTARVWSSHTSQEMSRMNHSWIVYAVAFSPDGNFVVSGSWDGTARVWDTQTGQEIARMTHDDLVTTVAFSPDGAYVASGSYDGTARVWDVFTGQEIGRMSHDDIVTDVAFSPDGKYVISGSFDGTARVWDVLSRHENVRMDHGWFVYAVAFSPDGKYAVSGSWDGTARVWDVHTGQEIARMTHASRVTTVAFSPDGAYVASGSYDDTVRVWDAHTGQEIARMSHDDIVTEVAFSPDGKYVISGSWDNTARIWSAQTGQEIARMTHDDLVITVAISQDGMFVASGSRDGIIQVWNGETEEEISRMAHEDYVSSIAISPDGKYVASGSFDGTARIWDLQSGLEITRMTHDEAVTSIAFSPDGKYLVSGSYDFSVRVWEVQSGQEIARMIHDDTVQSVSISPDGMYVASGSDDDTARVWVAQTGQEIARMTHDDNVTIITFSPDGTLIASGGWDNTSRAWSYSPEDLIADACSRSPRSLTEDEWQQFIGDVLPFQAVCPNLSVGP